MKKSKGFTLVELLATILILALIIGIIIYLSLNAIDSAKDKSYETSVKQIEKHANSYVMENGDRLAFITSDDGKFEYQCVTVQNLVDYGYLSANITSSQISKNESAKMSDYIYLERDIKTKSITRAIYTPAESDPKYINYCEEGWAAKTCRIVHNKAEVTVISQTGTKDTKYSEEANICVEVDDASHDNLVNAKADITIIASPSEWSKSKDVTIKYRLKNLSYEEDIDKYNFNYSYTGNKSYDPSKDTKEDNVKTKYVQALGNGKMEATIKLGNQVMATKNLIIDKIDLVGPVIKQGTYMGNGKVRHKITIPLETSDYGIGIDHSTFNEDDLQVKVGNTEVKSISLARIKGTNNYNLEINNDLYNGPITITIANNKVFDMLGNGNNTININTKIEFNNVYTVTFDANYNKGTANPATKKVQFGSAYGTLSTVTRKGYKHIGWYTKAAAGKGDKIEPSTKFELIYDPTLYAHWEAVSYTIKYDPNTGEGENIVPSVHAYETRKALKPNTYTKKGYLFDGWNTKADGTGTNYSDKQVVLNLTDRDGAEITLYAKWKPITYTIKYDGNGATSGSTESAIHTYDKEQNLTTNGFSRIGYTFKNWNTQKNGSGTAYNDKQSVLNLTDKDKAVITLYAQWTPNTYYINYTCRGGSCNGPTRATYDKAVQINNPSKTVKITGNANGSGASVGLATSKAQTFAGWTSTTLGSYAKIGTNSNPTTSWSGTSTKNTYFKNLRESGTVTMVANWTPVSMNLPTLSKSCSSCYWYTNTGSYLGGSSSSYTPTATSSANITVYASCSVNTYTIRYNANNGSGAPASQTKTCGRTLTLSSTIPTRTGYTFLGWSTSRTATTATYSAGGSYTNNYGATLYAVWRIRTYTISYNANGGSNPPSSQTKTHNVTLTLSSTKPIRNGYKFLGWSTSKTATTATYSAGGTYTSNSSATLYAVWEAGCLNNATVTLNSNGASWGCDGTKSVTATCDNNLPKIEIPEKRYSLGSCGGDPWWTGYEFCGYYDSNGVKYYNGNGESVRNWDKSSDTTLYAKWGCAPTFGYCYGLYVGNWGEYDCINKSCD